MTPRKPPIPRGGESQKAVQTQLADRRGSLSGTLRAPEKKRGPLSG